MVPVSGAMTPTVNRSAVALTAANPQVTSAIKAVQIFQLMMALTDKHSAPAGST
jgi:hypothetical protein